MALLHLLTALQDTVAKAASSQIGQPSPDSITFQAPPPLSGGPATVARFLLNTVPQWVQIGGVIVGAIVGLVVVVLLVKHWRSVLAWFGAKSNAWKTGFAGVVVVAAGVGGFAGLKTWNFMMHDNAFCSGCHVMNTPFQKFGTQENKHAKLLCHDCHQQSIFASMKELYVWVLDRPEKIPAHPNNVPNRVCAECHVQRDADSTWKKVLQTAGHQVHLNGRSPLFKSLECIVCHAQEVHKFKTADKTCGQAGCHDKVKIQIGKMANQTDLHCATCHKFTVEALEVNPLDSARAALTPKQKECFSCHEMKKRLSSFNPDSEPHKAVCGTCHNPHTQTTQFGAFQSCATAQCHAQADTLTAMHRGLGDHKLDNCGACHVAHTWKAKAKDCRSCHQDIDKDKTRTRRGAMRLSAGPPSPGAHRPLVGPVSWSRSSLPARRVRPSIRHGTVGLTVRRVAFTPPSPQVAADTATFSHKRHKSLACTLCHSSTDAHGTRTVRNAAQCRDCHHANNATGAKCESCHARETLPKTIAKTVAMRFATRAPTERSLAFAHAQHAKLECAKCHGTDVTRKVEQTCVSCHADHHTADRACTACHADSRSAHQRSVHLTGCAGSGCHTSNLGAAISPARNVCVACHAAQATHKPGQDCATCHLTDWSHSAGE